MDNIGVGSNTPLQTRFFSGAIPQIPRNIEQIMEIKELISLFRNQTLDLPKFNLLYKTLKAASLTVSNIIVLNCINIELLAANTQKK